MGDKQENLETQTQSEKMSKIGLVARIMCSVAVPFTAPLFSNLKNKGIMSAAIFAVPFGINIYQTGMISDENKTFEYVKFKEVPMLKEGTFVRETKSNWDKYVEHNNENNELLKWINFGALFISPGYVYAVNSTEQNYDDVKKVSQYFETSFSITNKGYTDGGVQVSEDCSLTIKDVTRKVNGEKLFNIDNYELTSGNKFCEHAFGVHEHGMKGDSFGWAKRDLETQLLKAISTNQE